VEELTWGKALPEFGGRNDSVAASSGFLVDKDKVDQALRDF
jgi:hypothetical protein